MRAMESDPISVRIAYERSQLISRIAA